MNLSLLVIRFAQTFFGFKLYKPILYKPTYLNPGTPAKLLRPFARHAVVSPF